MSSVSSLDGATAELLDGRHGTKQKVKPHHRALPHRAESSSFDSGDSLNSNGLVNGCSEAESLEETSLFTVQKPSPVSLAASYDSGMGSMVSSMTAVEHDCDVASAVVARDVYDVASFDVGGKKCKNLVLKGVVDEAVITKLDFNTPNVRDKELHEASLMAAVKDVIHYDDVNKCTAVGVPAASLSNTVDSDPTQCDLSASISKLSTDTDSALHISQIPKSQEELCVESDRSTGSHEHIVISVPARVDSTGGNIAAIAPAVPPRPPLRTSFREKTDPSDDPCTCFASDTNATNTFHLLTDSLHSVTAVQLTKSSTTTAESHNVDVPPRPPSRPSATKSPRTVIEHNRQLATPLSSHNVAVHDAVTSDTQPPPLPRRVATHHHRDPPPLPSRKNELVKRHTKSPDSVVRCPDGHVCTVTFRQPDGFVIPTEACCTTDKDNDPPIVPPKRVHANRTLAESSRNNTTTDRANEPIHVPVSEITSLLESPQLLPRRTHSPPITRRVRTEVPARRSNTMMLPLSGAVPHSTVPPVAQQDRLVMATMPGMRHQQQQQQHSTPAPSSQPSTKQRLSIMDNIRHTVVNFFNPHDIQHSGARRKTKSKYEFPDLPRVEATPNEYEKWGPRSVASDNLMSVFIRPPPPIPLRRVDVALEGGSTLSTSVIASESEALVSPTEQDSLYLRTTDSSTPVVTPTSSTSDVPLPVPPRVITERRSPVSRPGSAVDGVRNSADQHNASTLAAFADTLSQLKDYGWYWGPMSFEEAENKLKNAPDGSFLVRDSSNDRYILSLTFRAEGRTRHTRIEYHKGRFGFGEIENSFGFGSVVDLIENTVEESLKGNYCFFLRHPVHGRPPTRVLLTSPVSRFATMRSLQHMCRFVILRSTRFDHIDCLPLPSRLKHYLKDPHYYAEQQ